MYSRNMEKLLLHFIKDGVLLLDARDEIVRHMVICQQGIVVHADVAAALASHKELAA
jgi:hypothetical protein